MSCRVASDGCADCMCRCKELFQIVNRTVNAADTTASLTIDCTRRRWELSSEHDFTFGLHGQRERKTSVNCGCKLGTPASKFNYRKKIKKTGQILLMHRTQGTVSLDATFFASAFTRSASDYDLSHLFLKYYAPYRVCCCF